MWNKVFSFFRKREAGEFSENASGWHKTCSSIAGMYIDALNDENPDQPDIGVVLDKTDRMLFAVRDHLSALRPALNRRDRALSKRVNKASERLYEVRNMTAKFLIRAQGHTPHYLREKEMSADAQQAFYYKAMHEVGFEARQAAIELRDELKSIWTVLHVMVTEADEVVRE